MARLRRLQRPHKATLGRPTWKRGQLKSLSLPNVRSKEGRKERRKIFPWGKSFAPLLPPLSLAPFQFPISPPSPSLFCSLTNHPYLNVCNGIGLMPLHRRREEGGGGRGDTGIRGRLRDGFLRSWPVMISPYFSLEANMKTTTCKTSSHRLKTVCRQNQTRNSTHVEERTPL